MILHTTMYYEAAAEWPHGPRPGAVPVDGAPPMRDEYACSAFTGGGGGCALPWNFSSWQVKRTRSPQAQSWRVGPLVKPLG